MIPEEVWSLVPKEEPVEVPDWKKELTAKMEFTDEQRRAYYWATHLLEVNRKEMFFLPRIVNSSITSFSAGFIRLPTEKFTTSFRHTIVRTENVSYTFGITVTLKERNFLPDEMKPFFEMDSLDGFPVVVDTRGDVMHAPPHPHSVVSSCYAVPRTGKTFRCGHWSNGILIARHVLTPPSPGTSVPMTTGSPLRVTDVDGADTIDAAILGCTTIPSSANSLPLRKALGIGDDVTVRTSTSSFAAQVLRIHDDPKYFGNMITHRVIIDTAGSVGDSGALVTHTRSGDAVGIYIGKTNASPPEGLVQSMRQVTDYFEIDLFD
jgi:hypothetical protein